MALKRRLHGELMVLLKRQDACPPPRKQKSTELVFKIKRVTKKLLGRNLWDLYDLERWANQLLVQVEEEAAVGGYDPPGVRILDHDEELCPRGADAEAISTQPKLSDLVVDRGVEVDGDLATLDGGQAREAV